MYRIRGFGVLFLLFFLIPVPPAVSQPAQTVNSIVMSFGSGNIMHYQVTENGIYRVWSKTFDITYTYLKVADLNNDGINELILVSAQEGVRVIDLDSGNTIWTHIYLANENFLTSVQIADLTGDGFDEIVVSRTSTNHIPSIDVFNYQGDLIQQIPSLSTLNLIRAGADSTYVYDINGDGRKELFILFGNVWWNQTSSSGKYTLQRWNWNSGKFEIGFNVTIPDNGGHTQMIVVPHRVITSGWYNSPIRAFNETGGLVWEYRFFDKDVKLNIAEPPINVLEDRGNYHLITTSQNYWYNKTMKFVDLDTLTGQVNAGPFDIGQTQQVLQSEGPKMIFQAVQMQKSGENAPSFWQVRKLTINDGTLQVTKINDQTSPWDLLLHDFHQLQLLHLHRENYIIYSDRNGQWLTSDGKERLPFTPKIEGVISLMATEVPKLSSSASLYSSFDESGINNILIFASIVFLVLLLSIGYLYFLRQQEKKFDFSFANWKELFRLKLNEILQRIRDNLGPDQLPPGFVNAPSLPPLQATSSSVTLSNPEQEAPKYLLKPVASTTDIFQLLNSNTNVAKTVKIGDMAILIEILANYPLPSEVNELIPKFQFSAKQTIYKRIEKLEDLELIVDVKQESLNTSMTRKVVELTPSGIQLLSILHNSLRDNI